MVGSSRDLFDEDQTRIRCGINRRVTVTVEYPYQHLVETGEGWWLVSVDPTYIPAVTYDFARKRFDTERFEDRTAESPWEEVGYVTKKDQIELLTNIVLDLAEALFRQEGE